MIQEQEQKPASWEFFFRCQRSPVLRSQLVTALLTGTTLQQQRIPNAMLLDVVLMATAARTLFDSEIVDDYEGLLRRAEEEWARPEWTCRTFDSTHARWANVIIHCQLLKSDQERVAYALNFKDPEVSYIAALTQFYLDGATPQYFKKEISK